MKLNFWQVLGIILIVIYLILWISGVVGKNKESHELRSPTQPDVSVTQPPATVPSE